MNKWKPGRIIFILSLLLSGFLCIVLLAPYFSSESASGVFTIAAMLSTHGCEAPCVFGVSLNNATYDDVRELLQSAAWTRQALIEFEEDHISWRWSDTVIRRLVSDEFPGLSQFRDLNYIDFEGGVVENINIVFALPLEDVIAEFGNEFRVYPYGYYGRFTTYALMYETLRGGILEAMVDCTNPQMTPKTFLMNYYYRRGLTAELAGTSDGVPWQGYETQLADCTAFQPG